MFMGLIIAVLLVWTDTVTLGPPEWLGFIATWVVSTIIWYLAMFVLSMALGLGAIGIGGGFALFEKWKSRK